ncbi:MAG: hypothetical protein JKY37_21295 [Nannocystaceae bacterium]|nr:hypothetical protein [Nannocystaceae bacterium]
MWSAALLVFVLEPPCYGFQQSEQFEGQHVWVEYDQGALSVAEAAEVAAAADHGWDVLESLGWPMPPGPISVRVDLDVATGRGRCITLECEGVDVPLCEIYEQAFVQGYVGWTTPHEIGHAFQYALMGHHLQSQASWSWWMEGTATWMTAYFEDEINGWVAHSSAYLENPQWTLQHSLIDLISGPRGAHMYGTSVLAFFIDEYYGGPDTILGIWRWGAERSGEPIFFPDAIDGVGLDFDAFWPHYLATLSVLDLDVGGQMEMIPAHTTLSSLPDRHTPPDAMLPEGLGVGIVHIPAELGVAGNDLHVVLEVDPAVKWHAVVARTDGIAPGSQVLQRVTGVFDPDGRASFDLTEFDGTDHAFVVVSPETVSRIPRRYTISAALVQSAPISGSSDSDSDSDGDGDADQTDERDGCGCRSHRTPPTLAVLLVLLSFARPRRGRLQRRRTRI